MQTWTTEGDNLRCLRHGVTFGRLQTCPGCVDDPGPDDDEAAEPPVAAPEGCISRMDLERDAVATMRAVDARLTGEGKGKGKKIPGYVYAKLVELKLKANRLAGDYAAAREDDAIVDRRHRRIEERRRGGHH